MNYQLLSIKTIVFTVLLSSTLLLSAQTNEGVFKLTTTNASINETAHVEWLMKDNNHKIIVNSTANGQSASYTLLLLKGNPNAYLLTEVDGKKAMFTTLQSSMAKKGLTGTVAIKIEKGDYQIGSYSAQKVIFEGDNQTIAVWVSTDLPIALDALPSIYNPSNIMDLLKTNGIKGIPIKLIAKDSSGEILYTQTIEMFTAISVDSNEFDMTGYEDGAELVKKSMQTK